MTTEMENALVEQPRQRQVRPVLLCVGVDQIVSLAKLGLARKNWSESWIAVCHSSQEARELVAENEGILEAWVYGSNDMEAMNLAAGLKFERNSLRVFLLADSGTGSFMSRCDAAHIVARVGSSAVLGLFASAEQVYGGVSRSCKEEIVRLEDAYRLGEVRELESVPSFEAELQGDLMRDKRDAAAKVIAPVDGDLGTVPELDEPARVFAEDGVTHDSSSLETVPFKVVRSRPSGSESVPSSNDSFVLSVVSGSGGSGKSSVAAMIGCLSQMTGAKTLVVDADFQFGDEPWLLGRKAPFDLVELVRHENRIGELVCEGGLPAVLSAPERLEDSELAIASIKHLVALARRHFDVIVVNTGSFWVDAHLDLLEVSDRSLFVMDQRPTSIRSCARAIELCVRCGLPLQRFSFVLNGCGRQALLSSLDASCALKGVKVGELRYGGDELAELLGAGLPLELIETRNPFVMDLASFVDDFLPLPSSALGLLGKGGSKRMRRRRPQKPKRRRAS